MYQYNKQWKIKVIDIIIKLNLYPQKMFNFAIFVKWNDNFEG